MIQDRHKHIVMPVDHMDQIYNSKNWMVRFVHNNRIKNIVKSISQRQKIKKVLDAGCGEGHLLESIYNSAKDYEYYGVDITPVALDRTKLRCPFADIKQADISETNYPNDFFDVVICSEVLEHVYNFKLALNEFNRILKPGGILIITFPNEFLWTISRFLLGRKPIKAPDHVNSFSPNKMKKYVNIRMASMRGLPFRLPFFTSLGYLMKFEK